MTQPSSEQGIRRVLSIDGGGIRGIIPALVVAYLERIAKKPAFELFDLMVGTSTGGMLALGLSLEGDGSAPLFNAVRWSSYTKRMAERSLSNLCGENSGPSVVFLTKLTHTKRLRGCWIHILGRAHWQIAASPRW